MLTALFLVPLLPLLGFAVLAFLGGRLGERAIAAIGVTAGGLAAVVAIAVAAAFLAAPPQGYSYTQVLWTWLNVGGFAPRIAFLLDPVSVVFMVVVAFVGFLILLYSVQFMRGEDGYRRYFAYMDLFIGSMLILVLARDLLFLLIGWEGVGLSSFLLIGFWYRDPANGAAARKAFIITRIGDTALLVALLLIFTRLGTLDIPEAMASAFQHWAPGSLVVTAAATLILVGAMGKSAQVPLHTWLPDAMAGPTPVSALIHAATMVTAGVYLIARTHVLFELSPVAMRTVAIVGAVTLFYAGTSALAQWDIKRVLAYSTISQIGYMFLALGVGAWSAAVFHFLTHAFFKALLFLAAGMVIKAPGGEHDIRKMGGLRRQLPFVFWTFLIGAASLSALPVVTAGFYSKDQIVGFALTSTNGSLGFYVVAAVGAFLTSLYSFRLVFLVFFGSPRGSTAAFRPRFPLSMSFPVGVLAFLAITAGFLELPRAWGGPTLLTDLLGHAVPAVETVIQGTVANVVSPVIVALASVSGIELALLVFGPSPRRRAAGRFLSRLGSAALAGWGFDRLFAAVFVRPFESASRAAKADPVDAALLLPARASAGISTLLSRSQSGKLRYYLAVAGFGVLVFVAVGVLR